MSWRTQNGAEAWLSVPCMCVCKCVCALIVGLYQELGMSSLRGQPTLSFNKVELAELIERFFVNAAKCTSLICCDFLCSMVLLLKNTLITLLLHTLTFAAPWIRNRSGKRRAEWIWGESKEKAKEKGSDGTTLCKVSTFYLFWLGYWGKKVVVGFCKTRSRGQE